MVVRFKAVSASAAAWLNRGNFGRVSLPWINVSGQIPSGHVYLNVVSVFIPSRWARLYSTMHRKYKPTITNRSWRCCWSFPVCESICLLHPEDSGKTGDAGGDCSGWVSPLSCAAGRFRIGLMVPSLGKGPGNALCLTKIQTQILCVCVWLAETHTDIGGRVLGWGLRFLGQNAWWGWQ